MRIADTTISRSSPPYIIAEIGVNHDAQLSRAIELIDAAAQAGASAVKFQLFRADMLLSRAALLANYQSAAGETDPIKMLQRLELPTSALAEARHHAAAINLQFIITVFSLPLVEQAELLEPDAYKSASPDIIHHPLLTAMSITGRPLIVSTGAANMSEISAAAELLQPAQSQTAFLHCVSAYPTPPDSAALGAIPYLLDQLPVEIPVGYSDHTAETSTGSIAVALGATILEKHLTYSRTAQGPDHAASLEPDQFAEYVSLANAAHADRESVRALGVDPDEPSADPRVGPRTKRVLEIEQDVRNVSRQSIAAARHIRAESVIEASDLCFQRPGTGLNPTSFSATVGRRARRTIESGELLAESDLL